MKFYQKMGMMLAITGLAFSAWAHEGKHCPCKPIVKACKKAGYHKHGAEGKRLIMDCVQPIAEKKMTLPNTTFSDEMLQKCAAKIAAKQADMDKKQ